MGIGISWMVMESSEMMLMIGCAALIFMLYLTFLGDLLQYVFRTITSILGHPNLSNHLTSLAMLGSRVGASVGLLIIGFFIDTGVKYYVLFFVYITFTILLGITYMIIAVFTESAISYVLFFINRYYKLQITFEINKHTNVGWKNPKIDIMLVFSIGLLGFLIPSISASLMPEFKATLLQTGFILSSFSTLYFTLVIEKKLVLILNSSSDYEKLKSYKIFMYSRAVGCFFSALFLLVLFYFISI